MKKLICILLSVLMILPLTACNNDIGDQSVETSDPDLRTAIRIAGMKGPTSIGLSYLLEKDEKGESYNDYEFTLAGTADEITPKLIKGELDMACVPANLASVLYNKSKGQIKVLAVNTLGVLYIVSKNENITSWTDLKGKTIIATGKGTTPEYTLRHILSKNGIDPDKDITLDFKTEATEVVAQMKKSENAIALLPQPYVTVALSQVEGLKISLDLNQEWKRLNNGKGIVTGVLVGYADFVDNNKLAVNKMLEEYKASIESVNTDAKATSVLVEKFGIFDKAAVIEKAIPYCNISYIDGNEMIEPISEYLATLYDQNPQSIGGKMPDSSFYYVAE